MSVFRFRLEAVRKLRKRAEEARAGDLAEAVTEAGTAREERDRIEAIELAGREQLQRLNGNVAHLKSVQVVMAQLEQVHDEVSEKCREADETLRERQSAFVEAVTERRAIERLKDRREKSWRLDASRREQKTLDEVSSTRHQRAAGPNGHGSESEGDR